MGDQAFDAPQRLGQREQLHRLEKPSDGVSTTLELERDDGAEAFLLRPRESVPGM